MTLGVVAFVVVLLLSIMLHEAGHFLTAKRFGMKATQFFLGFGPTLWSFRRGETEYGVKAIPAGGFVKIEGMTPLDELAPGEEERAFYRQPAPQRAVVLAAGSVTHFLLAFVLLFAVLVGLGVPTGRETTALASVSECVPATPTQACRPDDPPSPAKAAGLRPGDRIVEFAGEPVTDWRDFTQRVRHAPPGPTSLVVERDGRRVTLRPSVVLAERPSLADPSRTERVGVLGIVPQSQTERVGPVAGLGRSAELMGRLFAATGQALVAIPAAVPKLWDQALHDSPRDASGLIGPVGAARISGQALETGAPATQKVASFLLLMAGLNVFIGVFNLLPLLPLDGGHLAILAFEQARSRIARALGRRDPGRVDLTKLLPAAYFVVALFIGLSVLLLLSDIVNPVTNPFR
ncbi:MAG TPA: site-2 protease family protein [Mycobacteriales bacterium]|nr:site-2 protease family protein [Mycobacteriales bacterium]